PPPHLLLSRYTFDPHPGGMPRQCCGQGEIHRGLLGFFQIGGRSVFAVTAGGAPSGLVVWWQTCVEHPCYAAFDIEAAPKAMTGRSALHRAISQLVGGLIHLNPAKGGRWLGVTQIDLGGVASY